MNLKEAFRYQNYLAELLSSVEGYLYDNDNVTVTNETHFKADVGLTPVDEVLTIESKEIPCTPNQMIEIMKDILIEREKVYNRIADAKRKAEIDIDTSIAINKTKQDSVRLLKYLSNIKSSESSRNGIGYKFNNEGNQINCYYKIESVKTINFDRNIVKSLCKKLSDESDKKSSELEKVILDTELDFQPRYDINDTLDDIIEAKEQ